MSAYDHAREADALEAEIQHTFFRILCLFLQASLRRISKARVLDGNRKRPFSVDVERLLNLSRLLRQGSRIAQEGSSSAGIGARGVGGLRDDTVGSRGDEPVRSGRSDTAGFRIVLGLGERKGGL